MGDGADRDQPRAAVGPGGPAGREPRRVASRDGHYSLGYLWGSRSAALRALPHK